MALCYADQHGRVQNAKHDAEEIESVEDATVIEPAEGERIGYQLQITLAGIDALPAELATVLGQWGLDTPVSQPQGDRWTVVATAQ